MAIDGYTDAGMPGDGTQIELYNPFDSSPVYYKAVTRSTMDDAQEAVSAGALHGTVCVSDVQRSGRGRLPDRNWHSDSGESLMFTVALQQRRLEQMRRSLHPGTVALSCGLGLTRTLQTRFGLNAGVKWPNDVMVAGGKISGILATARAGWYFIGIGVNCNQKTFPPGLRREATSIFLQTANRVQPLVLLSPLLVELRRAFEDSSWREELEMRLAYLGKRVTVRQAEGMPALRGTIAGLGEDGALLLQGDNTEITRVYAGEIEEAAT